MLRLTSRPRRDQASRAISTARLKRSRALHLPPINVVVSHGPSGVSRPGSVHLGEGFPLRCIQRLSPRDIANRRCPWQDSRDTRGRFVRVLSYYGRRPSTLQRPHRIQTELSHDVVSGRVRSSTKQGWYFTVGSPRAKTLGSSPPTYATQVMQTINGRL